MVGGVSAGGVSAGGMSAGGVAPPTHERVVTWFSARGGIAHKRMRP